MAKFFFNYNLIFLIKIKYKHAKTVREKTFLLPCG